jgi:hypothetical protein
MVQLSDLQLEDVVEISSARGGGATVIIAIENSITLPVMVGWDANACALNKGKDNFKIKGATYLPNAEQLFENALWINLHDITRVVSRGQPKVAAKREAPCRQCQRKNDLTASKCWWCECLSPTLTPVV